MADSITKLFNMMAKITADAGMKSHRNGDFLSEELFFVIILVFFVVFIFFIGFILFL